MSEVQLSANIRHVKGKAANRQLRREEKIPAVLYGPNLSVMLEMEEEPTRRILSQLTGTHQLLPLQVTDSKSGETSLHYVLLQEIQQHPYKEDLIHIDFRKLDPEKPVNLKVPLKIVGQSPGVKKGGVLQMVIRDVPITCLPSDIPEYIEADVSHLDLRETMRVSELKYPEKVTARARQNYSVISIVGRRK